MTKQEIVAQILASKSTTTVAEKLKAAASKEK